MITINGHVVVPTMFPDGTSQVWHLPNDILGLNKVIITWYFESESELMTLLSLRSLLGNAVYLYLPYFPYARQDKEVSNDTTFNLSVFVSILQDFRFTSIETVDVHNPQKIVQILHNSRYVRINDPRDLKVNDIPFINKNVTPLHKALYMQYNMDYIVYPDEGAMQRYNPEMQGYSNILIGKKLRDPSTGHVALNGWKLISDDGSMMKNGDEKQRFLIVDDVADGGATFVEIAKKIRKEFKNPYIMLFVTHGLFSKGKQVLLDAGINEILTTNTLLRNKEEGIKV